MNALVHLRMFDVVMNHTFMTQKPKDFDGFTIPQEEFEKFENARRYTLYLHRLNLLEPFYKRIMEGKV